MPELPEVEVVRRGLAPRTVGRTIEAVEVLDSRIIRRQVGGVDRLRGALVGTRMTAVVRRGKFLWWRLADGPDAAEGAGADTGEALMGHLGMSGQLRVRTPGPMSPPLDSEGPASDPLRHRRLTLHLDDGTAIDLIDQRLFGGLWTSPLEPSADGRLAGLGSPDTLLPEAASGIARDLLDPAADLPSIARTLRTRRAGVKSLLLSQSIVSGIGNIYADEALWRARLHGERLASALTRPAIGRLLDHAKEVMAEALEQGGTSFDELYVNVNGASGYFDRSLSAYGQEGRPCPRCGTTMRREQFMNRSSTSCPRCQIRPRGIGG